MPINMLVLPISDFDVVLGINYLNKYQATIDCPRLVLSLEVGEKQLKYTLVNQRSKSMIIMELWEKPIFATITVDEVTVVMVLVVRESIDVFPDNLPGFPQNRKTEFGIDVLLGTALISKASYGMAPMELHELKV